ncbi:phage-related protein (Xylella fastidiosa) [Aequoribacter fuscus]|uniref:Phage-related protein (Xylella fastidiosa) n=2 Tax=Aequoribacter fuscus TaxID=2518989 RepID=F3KZI5_9GAMM|nr:phage-related protein (Xylella fastidiosa) [Aequoribacter fuscus]
MTKLGDGLGCSGYNTVLTSATASYVSHVGRDRAEETRAALKADIGERIDAADQSNHSREEISRYESDAYLDSLISSAIEKFGDKPPYWDEPELSLQEGEQKLQAVIDEFGNASRAFHQSINLEAPILAVKATAGLGKTRSVIKRLLAYNLLEHGDIHYYVPSHALSNQLIEDLNDELSLDISSEEATYERARVIYGRGREDDAGVSLCRKADVANKIAAMGGNVYPLLCRNTSGQCEYFDNCAYLQQLEEEELPPGDIRRVLTEVKVMTHEHLFLRTKDRFADPALIVIDEGFAKSAHKSVELPIKDILAFASPESLIAEVADLLIRQEQNLLEKLRAITTSIALLDELDQYEGLQSSGFPSLDIESSTDAQLSALRSAATNNTPLLIRTLAYELQTTDRDISHAVVSDGVTATILRRKELDLPNAPVLMIDADANQTILETFFERSVSIESIRVERQAEVHQFNDRTFSMTGFADSDVLLEQVHRFISGVAQTGATLVVANKKVTTELEQLSDTGAMLNHFNNLRGVNAYAYSQNVVLIGRNQPSTPALEAAARGIWFAARAPLRLLGDVSGSKPFRREQRGYRVRTGGGTTDVQVHPDWRAQALLE